jgi:stage V sporulation protein SpoVS
MELASVLERNRRQAEVQKTTKSATHQAVKDSALKQFLINVQLLDSRL